MIAGADALVVEHQLTVGAYYARTQPPEQFGLRGLGQMLTAFWIRGETARETGSRWANTLYPDLAFGTIQDVREVLAPNRTLSGVEYVTWDEDTQTLRSHLMADDGSNFTYTHQVDEDGTSWTWFGDKGSDNFFKGTLSADGKTLTGRWQWPGSGFDSVSKKVDE